jgi:regulator of protease activity HflC (stomatin/prohibitin superfamily)
MSGMFVALVLAGLAVVLILKGVYIVNQNQTVVIERLGSFSKLLTSGPNFIIPFVDNPRPIKWVDHGMIYYTSRIDLRESVLDIPEQSVITKDNVSINIDAIMYIQITDPFKATYEIENLPSAVAQLAQTSLRNVIGEMDLDSTLGSRDVINAKLKSILDDATDKWGTKVNRVELRNITPPRDIQQAMEKQMQAERERRAKVLEAQGDKEARIARSEGQKIEQINLAEGAKEAEIRRADGEAMAVERVADAKMDAIVKITSATKSSELAAQFLIANSYIDAFQKFAVKEGDKVFIPYESSTALGALGSIKELLSASEAKK